MGGTRRAAIVTSGSLCPGQNEVIAELFSCLYFNYGIDTVYGIRGGFSGFYNKDSQPLTALTPQEVSDARGKGGSILGFRKGGFDAARIMNACEVYGVNHVFIVGGDGSHICGEQLNTEARRRASSTTICCVPNSLENDLGVIDTSFGFHTAVQEAVGAISSVTTEAQGAPFGIGIVRLLGEHSGYLATHATLAAGHVDLCLIPEAAFQLEGPGGVLDYLWKVVQRKGHAVVVVAEGVGNGVVGGSVVEDEGVFLEMEKEKQRRGERIDRPNLALFIKQEIEVYFTKMGRSASTKYVDPSYMVRSVPASASDIVHCLSLSHNAVHGALHGLTNFSSAIVNNRSVLVPIPLVVRASPSKLSLKGRTWERVLAQTQQPSFAVYDEDTKKRIKQWCKIELQHAKL
jgi:6-phosphofructokinase 1